MLSGGWGLGAAVDAAGKATGAFTYGIIGTTGWFLTGAANDVAVLVLFFFMMVFMDTTATIPTGAMAERWAWKNFCLFGLWVALPYCLYANWVWGGGFLAQGGLNWGLGHGAVDFAGSGVVHAMGGFIGLAGAMVIGPRIGKFVNGKPQALPGHDVPMVVLGTFILALGWFGFNPGSTLSGTDLRISYVVVNTMLASVTGALGAMVALSFKGLKPDPTMLCNGMLAGLVAITAPCAFVDPWGAAVIGAIAGWLVVESVFFFERRGVDVLRLLEWRRFCWR
jgi:Amt family ammonium transporter